MNGWHEATLGEICSLVTDGKHGDCRNEENSGYYFISAKDVREGRIHYEQARQIVQDDFAETHRRTDLRPGDLLITNSGTIGRMAIATDDERTARTTFQKSVAVLKPKPDQVSSRFLYYYLNANLTALIHPAAGAAQKNLLLGDIRRFRLKKPSLAEQDRIVESISTYDDLIENNRRRIGLLEEAARMLYREWFVHFRFPGHEHVKIIDGLPEGWERRFLFDETTPTYGHAFKSELFNEDEQGLPVVRIRDVPSGVSNTWTTEEAPEDRRLANGDFLVGMDGDFHMNFWSGGEAWLNQRVTKFNTKGRISIGLMRFLVEKPIQNLNETITGTTVKHLGDKHLKMIELALPPPALLTVPNEACENARLAIVNLAVQNQKLAQARDLLLPRLMNGEITV